MSEGTVAVREGRLSVYSDLMVDQKMTGDQQRITRITAALSDLVSRTRMAYGLGYQYENERNLYQTLGYKINLEFTDFFYKYSRGDIAKALIDKPVNATWRLKPEIKEADKKETPFEEQWKELVKKFGVFNTLVRLDKLMCLGRYSILLIGVNDGKSLMEPLEPAEYGKNRKLLYLQPYSELNAEIKTWNTNQQSERFNLPELYQITVNQTGNQSSFAVHHSRLIHVLQDQLESEVYGTPSLQAVFNRLQDLEKVIGGSAEMYWRGARPGYAALAKEGYDFGVDEEGNTDKDALQEQLDKFDNGLRRWLRVQGVDIQALEMQVVSPADQVNVQLQIIAAASGIPMRILLGSERGELASSQDERAWADSTDSRRTDIAEPVVVRPLIGKLIWCGILPPPETGDYEVDWPDLHTPSEKELAEVGKIKTESLTNYARTPGAQDILPVEQFLRKMLNFDSTDIEEATALIGSVLQDEFEDEPEDELEDEEE